MDKLKKVVCVGGGHTNCQVLKLLKQRISGKIDLTLISESDVSYYSGMLPGASAKLYRDDEIQIKLEPLAKWCNARFIQNKVERILASENKIILEDKSEVDYDILSLNIGSRTFGTDTIPGVAKYALTTRPINDLIGKIQRKEEYLMKNKIIPKVVVCGGGAAGIELSFAFKARWSKAFHEAIEVTLITNEDELYGSENENVRSDVKRKLAEKNIEIVTKGYVSEVTEEGVKLKDGRYKQGNVQIWATGAEPQKVTKNSELELMRDYYKVNEFLQSTSHQNIFAGGDCVTLAPYAKDKPFPPKAGVYAVREGPIIANNIINSIEGNPFEKYVPQTGFLSLLMTGDREAIGTKFGISFTGKWVWGMKDYIDMSFMKMFDPYYLFENYDQDKYSKPFENNERLEQEKQQIQNDTKELREKVNTMSAQEAADKLKYSEEVEEFFERLYIIERMGKDEEFAQHVVAIYNQLK